MQCVAVPAAQQRHERQLLGRLCSGPSWLHKDQVFRRQHRRKAATTALTCTGTNAAFAPDPGTRTGTAYAQTVAAHTKARARATAFAGSTRPYAAA